MTVDQLLELADGLVIAISETAWTVFRTGDRRATREFHNPFAGRQAGGLTDYLRTRDARDETIDLVKTHGSTEFRVFALFYRVWRWLSEPLILTTFRCPVL